MGDSGRSLEDKNAKRNTDSGCPTHEVSGRNKDFVQNLARGHLCGMLTKN